MKDKMRLYKLIFVLLLLFNEALAQNYRKVLDASLNYIEVDFEWPKGFSQLDSIHNFDRGDRKLYSVFIYSFVNKKQDVAIAFNDWKITKDSEALAANMKKMLPNYNPDHNMDYLTVISNISSAGGVKHPIVYHSAAYSRKNFNADISGEFDVSFRLPYKGKFNNGKVVFAHKKDTADIYLHYYYTDEAQRKIDKVIKKTSGMMRFKP